jgi:hypothetical protein
MTIPFPPYRPTSFELRLPGYPVITNNWRATEWPEILGNIAEGASLRLSYRNITDAEALELLLLWRATAGGRYPLNPLPAEVAAGINDAALADRILNIAPLVWVPAGPPSQESVKRIRSGLEIELVSELRFSPVIALPTVTCPVWALREPVGCLGAPPEPPDPSSQMLTFPVPVLVDVTSQWTKREIGINCTTGAVSETNPTSFTITRFNIRGNGFFTATVSGDLRWPAYAGPGPVAPIGPPGPPGRPCGAAEQFWLSNGALLYTNTSGNLVTNGLVGANGNLTGGAAFNHVGFHKTEIISIILKENTLELGAAGEEIIGLAVRSQAPTLPFPS